MKSKDKIIILSILALILLALIIQFKEVKAQACLCSACSWTCSNVNCIGRQAGSWCASGNIKKTCDGPCVTSGLCGYCVIKCAYSAKDCDDDDGIYDTGQTRWVSTGECTEKKQKEVQYRDYYCSGGNCTYSGHPKYWVDTGDNRCKAYGTDCGTDVACTLTSCSADKCDKIGDGKNYRCESGTYPSCPCNWVTTTCSEPCPEGEVCSGGDCSIGPCDTTDYYCDTHSGGVCDGHKRVYYCNGAGSCSGNNVDDDSACNGLTCDTTENVCDTHSGGVCDGHKRTYTCDAFGNCNGSDSDYDSPCDGLTCDSTDYYCDTHSGGVCDGHKTTYKCNANGNCIGTNSDNDSDCNGLSCGQSCNPSCPTECCTRYCDASGHCGSCTYPDCPPECSTDADCPACYTCSSGNCVNQGVVADGNKCLDDCTHCVNGSCDTRTADDNTECSTCHRCDGTNSSCQAQISVDTGYLCDDDCTWCNASANCTNRSKCASAECSGQERCDSAGGNCVDPDVSSVVCTDCYGAIWDSITSECCGDDGVSDDWCNTGNGSCVDGVWYDDHCLDGIQNCDETGVDTGGACGDFFPPLAMISCCPTGCENPVGICTGYTKSHFCLKNESTDPDGIDDIINSIWTIREDGTVKETSDCTLSGNPLCNWTLPSTFFAGNYEAGLYVEDSHGLSSTTTQNFTILQDAIAGFKCSLDNSNWQDCGIIIPSVGEMVYFLDQSSPSEGALIISRDWTFQDGNPANNFDNETNPSTQFQSSGNKEVHLVITDSAGRTDEQILTVGLSLPLPGWKEIPPF
jgi:hypothetical protein